MSINHTIENQIGPSNPAYWTVNQNLNRSGSFKDHSSNQTGQNQSIVELVEPVNVSFFFKKKKERTFKILYAPRLKVLFLGITIF